MLLSRRALLLGTAALAVPPARAALVEKSPHPFGVQSFSYANRLGKETALRNPLRFLQFCRERGADGVQTSLSAADAAPALRRYLDETGMWLEGSVRLPREAADVERFAADVRTAKAAGAEVLRAVMLGGRRYETFATAAEFRRFRETARESVRLASAVVAKHRVRLAVENHKDFRADELLDLLRGIGSEWVGITVDTGNSLALLETPPETVEALAPLAFSVHLKDMAVDEHPTGFLLSEVPFGKGFLDLPRLVALLRKHRPEIRFSIEMATRDPLVVPCLTERYWATQQQLPGQVLARLLTLVRERQEGRPLPRVSGLPPERVLQAEDENLRACLEYSRAQLK